MERHTRKTFLFWEWINVYTIKYIMIIMLCPINTVRIWLHIEIFLILAAWRSSKWMWTYICFLAKNMSSIAYISVNYRPICALNGHSFCIEYNICFYLIIKTTPNVGNPALPLIGLCKYISIYGKKCEIKSGLVYFKSDVKKITTIQGGYHGMWFKCVCVDTSPNRRMLYHKGNVIKISN